MSEKKLTVFIVDDDPLHVEMTKDALARFRNFHVSVFGTGEAALKQIRDSGIHPDIVILDYYLNAQDAGAANGLAILKKLMDHAHPPRVVMVSGQDKIEVAVNCIKYGAFEYLIKNESVFVRLEQVMKKILYERKLIRENKLYKTMFRILLAGFGLILAFMLYLWTFTDFDIFGSRSLHEGR